MKYLFLQALCKSFSGELINATAGNYSSYDILRDCKSIDPLSESVYLNIGSPEKDKDDEENSGAVMYIVAVLVFYSAGIVIMIVKYLRREKQELEEERILDDFFRTMPACKKERDQDNVNRVAIHAFHALTSFNDSQLDVSNVNESLVSYADTIEEVEDGQSSEQSYTDTDKVENDNISKTLITDV